MFMHALPGIVDGARKTSQVGWWVRGGARGRSCRFSSSPMLEATSSRNQCMNAAPSVVHHVGIFTLVNRLQLVHRCWITLSILGAHRRNHHCYKYRTRCEVRRVPIFQALRQQRNLQPYYVTDYSQHIALWHDTVGGSTIEDLA